MYEAKPDFLAEDYEDWNVASQAVTHLEELDPPEHQWMFIFAGYLKGRCMRTPGWEPKPDDFLISLKYFAKEVFERMGPSSTGTQWSDFEAVKLEFERAWEKRRFVEDSSYFRKAVAESRKNLLGLQPPMNGWVVRIVNLGFYLQELQPGVPFLIPVNVGSARQLGTSIRTLSLALAKAIELGFIAVEEDATIKGQKRFARRLTFNYDHPQVQAGLESARQLIA